MAVHSRLDTLQTIKGVGLVPIFNHSDVTMAKAIVKACAEVVRQSSSLRTGQTGPATSSGNWQSSATRRCPR